MAQYLVVANQTLGGQALMDVVTQRAGEGHRFHLVVPATLPDDLGHQALEQIEGVPLVEQGLARAEQRLNNALEGFRDQGIEASGEVGAEDPLAAIRDALEEGTYDGLIISTLPAGVSKWLRMDLPHRAEREFGLPVTAVEAARD